MAKTSTEVTTKGWMPEATKVAVPASNFAVGCITRKAAVLHISEGSALSAVSWFKNSSSGVSSHFIVSDAGQIFQCVSVLDTAYTNGLSWNAALGCWVDPEKNLLKATPPAWQGLTPPTNPNWQTVSIEREGHSKDQPSEAENAAVVRILQYVHETFPTLIPEWSFMQTLIGHCHISPIARANCPGPHVDYRALAAAANGPPPPPPTKRYRVRKILISTRSEGGAPYAGELQPGDIVEVDQTYADTHTAHLKDGRGFLNLEDIEAIS